jgi:hypothetical protein
MINCFLYLGTNGGPWTRLVDLLCGAIGRSFMRVLRRASGGGGGSESRDKGRAPALRDSGKIQSPSLDASVGQ